MAWKNYKKGGKKKYYSQNPAKKPYYNKQQVADPDNMHELSHPQWLEYMSAIKFQDKFSITFEQIKKTHRFAVWSLYPPSDISIDTKLGEYYCWLDGNEAIATKDTLRLTSGDETNYTADEIELFKKYAMNPFDGDDYILPRHTYVFRNRSDAIEFMEHHGIKYWGGYPVKYGWND